MVKPIVFLGDPHLSDRQISTRVDDTTETCLEKFEWVLNYAKSIDANIICTGDMFTHTLFNNRTRYRLKKAIREYRYSGGWLWSISGNHSGDIEDRNPDSALYRELGQFVLDGYVNFLGCFDRYCRSYFLDRSLTNSPVIIGYSAYCTDVNDSVAESLSDRVIGMVCHHFIGQECFGDPLVIYPDDMKKVFPNLRFIVGGHDHAHHVPYMSRDGVWVVRPGSMMRTDSGESSKRIPCVEVLYPRMDGEPDRWEIVPIACARSYDEVFFAEKRDINAGSVNALERFVRQMQEQTNVVMDINSAVKEQFALVPHEDRDMVRADLAAQGFMV